MTTTCQRQALHGPAVEAAFHLFSVVPLLLVRQPLLEKTVQICTEADPRRRRADTMGIPLAPRILRLKRKRYTRNAPHKQKHHPAHRSKSPRVHGDESPKHHSHHGKSKSIDSHGHHRSKSPMAARTPVATIEGNQSRKHPIH